jgi:hypothetical protein
MTDSIFGNASGFELLFLASAFVGVWFSRVNMVESWGDYKALGGIANGRRAIAVASILTETLLLSIHALYIIAGIVAAFTPASGNATSLTVLILSILVYASWAVTAISIVSRRLRRYLTTFGLQARDEHGRFTRET